METKANYVRVGIFTLITIALTFAFVLWLGRYDEGRNYVDLDIMIEGSVTGLAKGSPVLFNGIQVGTVSRLTIAANAPRFVNARVKIDSGTPVRSDTKASIGIQGFAGSAFVQLEGGSENAPNLLGLVDQTTGEVPKINADPAALADIMSRVNKIAARTETVMAQLEGFLGENRESIAITIKNAEKFSAALAQNADGVEKFMAGISSVSGSIQSLSTKLDGTIKGAEDIIKAVDPESVRKTVTNVEQFSETLKTTRDDITRVVASIAKAADDINKFSTGINETLTRIDTLVAGVDSTKVSAAVDDISAIARDARKVVAAVGANDIGKTLSDISDVIANANKVVAAVDPSKVTTIVDSIETTTKQASDFVGALDTQKVNSALENIDQAATGVNKVVNAVKPEQITGIVDGLEKTVDDTSQFVAGLDAEKLNQTLDDLGQAAADARDVIGAVEPQNITRLIDDLGKTLDNAAKVVSAIDTARITNVVEQAEKAASGAATITEDIAKITSRIRDRGDDVNQIITDASELASRLNTASERIDGVLARIDGMLSGGDGEGLMAEARATLADFRKLANNLDGRVREISKGLARFSTRGLGEAEVMIREARRSINRIDRVISDFEKNPQGFITGSPGVRQVNGSRPRR